MASSYIPAEGTADGQADYPTEDLSLPHEDKLAYTTRDPARNDAKYMGSKAFSMIGAGRQRLLGILDGYFRGLGLSTDTDTDHDIQIAIGAVADSTGDYLLELTSVLTKQIDAAWAEGDDAGGFPTGISIAATTTYNVFLIFKITAAGVITIDAGYDSSATAANLLADATTYSKYMKIGSVTTDGSSNVGTVISDGVVDKDTQICNGRLTLETGVAVSTSDQTAKTTLYFTPHKGDRIALHASGQWTYHTFGELSIAIPATTDTNYDVWVYDNAGTLTLELLVWTNATTRATAIVLQNGIYVKSGDTTRRYVGSIRTTGTSGKCEDSESRRFVWNYYSRRLRGLTCQEPADSWTTSATDSWVTANANATVGQNRVEFIVGVDEDRVEALNVGSGWNNTDNKVHACGIGLDSTSVNSAHSFGSIFFGLVSIQGAQISADYTGHTGIGYHYLQRLEYEQSGGSESWYGDNGLAAALSSGMTAHLWG